MSCFYKILGLPRRATGAEVKSAYISLVKKFHPDKNPGNPDGATKVLQAINNAYTTLSNQKLRSEYDNKMMQTRIQKVYRSHRPKSGEAFSSLAKCNHHQNKLCSELATVL